MSRFKLKFWQKPRWIETPQQELFVPPGAYTVSYTVRTDGKQSHSSTTVYPTVARANVAKAPKAHPTPPNKNGE